MVVLTFRFLALEEAHQLDVFLNIMETSQLTHVINDLHWILNHLRKKSNKYTYTQQE